MSKFKALIFDFDGIITDTEPVHMEGWLSVLEDVGITFSEDEYHARYLGFNDRDFLDAVSHANGCHFTDVQKSSMTEEKHSEVIRLLERNVPLLPGVKDFVEAAAKDHMLAICSGSTRGEIDYILRKLKWNSLFNPIVSAELVKKGKPDPEGYIRTLETLTERASDSLLAEEVLAIEDSPNGIAAANAAGIKCIAITNSCDPKNLSAAYRIFDSLSDVDLKNL